MIPARWLAGVALLCLAGRSVADSPGQALAESAGRSLIGAPAPPLVLHTIDGQTLDLRQKYGRQAVYLKFWATWCVPCREQMPHFERSYEQAGPDLAVIAVNAGFNDTVADIADYRAKLGLRMPMVRDDGTLAEAFHLRVTPQHVVIGRDGRILYVGHLADARLEAALREARSVPAAATIAAQRAPVGPARERARDALAARVATTIDGEPFPLGDPAGRRATVLVFLSPWCESYLATSRPAMATRCRLMRERVEALTSGRDRRWLGVASGLWATPEDLRAYRQEHEVRIPLALDETGDLFRAFAVDEVPVAVVVDASGRLRRRLDVADLATAAAFERAVGTP